MNYPLNQNVKPGYSIALADGYLTIQNGIDGTYRLFAASVKSVADCGDDKTCGEQIKRFKPDLLTVWGYKVDCCEHTLTKLALDPANFGASSSSELADILQQTGPEIRNTPQFIGLTDDGKPIFRESFLEEGFTSGNDFQHNRNIDKYLNVMVDTFLPADPTNKKELQSNASGDLSKHFYGDKQTDAIAGVTTEAGYTSLFIVLDYTVF